MSKSARIFWNVSSLYGRVYRTFQFRKKRRSGFLPIREGVSTIFRILYMNRSFPPYTGGCIEYTEHYVIIKRVSSLYGRVYRRSGCGCIYNKSFLPIREGVSFRSYILYRGFLVSSLYGRVYRWRFTRYSNSICFLPVREGVSQWLRITKRMRLFPPCMGGCIIHRRILCLV